MPGWYGYSGDDDETSNLEVSILNQHEQALRQNLAFTRLYRSLANEPAAVREVRCLAEMLPDILLPIRETDGFAGRIRMGHVGFSPEPGGLGYYCNEEDVRRDLACHDGMEPGESEILEMLDFWRTEQTSVKVRDAYPAQLSAALPTDAWTRESGVAFPLYRMAGSHPDYEKLVILGIAGLRELVQKRISQGTQPEEADPSFLSDASLQADPSFLTDAALQADPSFLSEPSLHIDVSFLTGSLAVLDLLSEVCLRYAAEASALSENASCAPAHRSRLIAAAVALTNIATGTPHTLREAIQLTWLYALVSGSMNYGRMDVYLGDFLARDLEEGHLTAAEAQDMVTSFWRLIAERNTTWNGRIILGGRGRRNERNADAFALLAMEATRLVPGSDPQLTLRWHAGMDESLMEKALSVLAEGRTFPMLYNDDVNINAVHRAFRLPMEEAVQYLPLGCGEYVIDHRSFGTPSGVINLLKAVEITLRNGRDPLTKMQIGPETGELSSFKSFDDFFDAYARQVSYFVAALAEQEKIAYEVAGRTAPFLFLSLLYDDCISRGLPLFTGGVRYLGGTIETYGNINAANSLLAVKKMLFDHPQANRERMISALDADFEGYPDMQRILLALPKYGNDHPEADAMATRVHEHVCHAARDEAERVGLHSYLVVVINNSANTTLGLKTAASPDGRRAGEPMANANNPWNGTDRMGLTAMLNSLVKLDPGIHAGAVQNIMMSPDLFRNGVTLVRQIIRAYFENGGTQAMISVVNRDDLVHALEAPDKFGHLFVRVGGFSARFVDLERNVQREILSRTQY